MHVPGGRFVGNGFGLFSRGAHGGRRDGLVWRAGEALNRLHLIVMKRNGDGVAAMEIEGVIPGLGMPIVSGAGLIGLGGRCGRWWTEVHDYIGAALPHQRLLQRRDA